MRLYAKRHRHLVIHNSIGGFGRCVQIRLLFIQLIKADEAAHYLGGIENRFRLPFSYSTAFPSTGGQLDPQQQPGRFLNALLQYFHIIIPTEFNQSGYNVACGFRISRSPTFGQMIRGKTAIIGSILCVHQPTNGLF